MAPQAIVMLAGRHQFGPHEVLHHPCVSSRRLVRCLGGRGTVRINGMRYELVPGDFLFLPWRHSISYYPDSDQPMLLSGVHVVPDFRPLSAEFNYGIPHTEDAPEAANVTRRDTSLPGFDAVARGTMTTESRLYALSEYIVEWFRRQPRYEWQARLLARLLIAELYATLSEETRGRAPREVSDTVGYIRTHLPEHLTLRDLAQQAGCGTRTLIRLFKAHLGRTPIEWLMHERLDRACRLLSTTSKRIGEIGQTVGLSDPYYFSKLFRRTYGMTARDYRRRNRTF